MTDEQKIWESLLDLTGNPYGAAGLMGNLYAESGLRAENLQNSKNESLHLTDDEYTAAVDYGLYKDFETDRCGYGIAQWTAESRKRALKQFARERETSIGDLDMQLLFLALEMAESYPHVLAGLRAAGSVREASDLVLTRYEIPKDQSEAVKAKRAAYGERYLEKYGGGTTSSVTACAVPPSCASEMRFGQLRDCRNQSQTDCSVAQPASGSPSAHCAELASAPKRGSLTDGEGNGAEDETTFFTAEEKAVFTNLQLKKFCETVYLRKWVYWYGTYGKPCSKALYNEKKAQYPEYYTASREAGYMTDIRNGHRCADCAGLIKAFYWCGADADALPKYGVNGFADRGADSIFRLCKETGKIGTIPDVPGALVWRSGHIGVYVGGGMTVEMKGFAYDCVRQKVEQGTWTHWGKLPGDLLEYVAEEDEGPHPPAAQAPSAVHGNNQPEQSSGVVPHPTGEGSVDGKTEEGSGDAPLPAGKAYLVIGGDVYTLLDVQKDHGGTLFQAVLEAE